MTIEGKSVDDQVVNDGDTKEDPTDDSENDQEKLKSPEDNEQETDSTDDSENSQESSDQDNEDSDSDDDEVTVTIGKEKPPEEETKEAPGWVKEVRKNNRELKKQNRELRDELKAKEGTEKQPVNLGKKPTLEDYDFDSDTYDVALNKWYEHKHEVDEQNRKKKNEEDNQQEEWQKRLSSYNDAKTKLKVRDFDEAEHVVQEALSTTQQGMIIQGADDPAVVLYALGKNVKKLKELSQIKDPVKFAFAVSKLETQMTVTSRKKPASLPEKTIKSSTGSSGTVDSTLDQLRKEAADSGDYTKVNNYKRQLRTKT